MLPYLRFLFDDADAARIDPDTIVVEDLPANGDFPLAMRIRFRLKQGAAPQIRPLLPGPLQFIVDPNTAGTLPAADAVAFTDAAYQGWKVVGTLLVKKASKQVSSALAGLAPDLLLKPNRVWYSPVRLSRDFLFNTICGRSGPRLPGDIPFGRVRPRGEALQRAALAGFLSGRYSPELRPAENAAAYQGILLSMPLAELAAANEYSINISTAIAQQPKDDADWDRELDDDERHVRQRAASHPRNGAIPGRLVYQSLRNDMVAPNQAATAIRNAVVTPAAGPSAFASIRFTRAWQPVEECSAFFPRQTIRFENNAGANLGERPLPAHGILFLDRAFVNSLPNPVRIRITGGMKWLLWSDEVWRQMGATDPVQIAIGSNPPPHIVMRLPMSQAMLSDKNRPQSAHLACTYLSLRRTVRALVDNRMTGGRLSFGVKSTSPPTRNLIQAAFDIANQDPAWQAARKNVQARAIVNDAPDPTGAPNEFAPRLIPVLDVFFPSDAPQENIAGRPANAEVYTLGKMAHEIWQSQLPQFVNNRYQRNFSPDHIGRGGPGAAVALGLATYVLNPAQRSGESNDAYVTRVLTAFLAGVQTGVILQYWSRPSDYESIRQRSDTAPSGIGHSPVFRGFRGPANQPEELLIIDQNGNSSAEISRQPSLAIDGRSIWIAANWLE